MKSQVVGGLKRLRISFLLGAFFISGFLTPVFFILGLDKLFKGKGAYTRAHERNVWVAMVLGAFGLIFLFVPAIFSGGLWTIETTYQKILRILGITMLAFVPVFLILELAEKRSRDLLWSGAFLHVIGAGVGAGYFLSDINYSFRSPFFHLGLVMISINVAAFFLFYFAYKKTQESM